MSLKWAIFWLVIAGAVMSGCARPPSSTVHEVAIYNGENELGSASGVMIAPMQMLTAAHVVEELQDGMVLYVGEGKAPAKVLRVDKGKDLALLQVAVGCPCVSVSDDEAYVDEDVVVIGFPMSNLVGVQVITRGQASGVNESGSLVFTAPIAPGNSGGGVFVRRWTGWRLAGIAKGVMAVPMGYSASLLPHLAVAVPVKSMQEFLNIKATPA